MACDWAAGADLLEPAALPHRARPLPPPESEPPPALDLDLDVAERLGPELSSALAKKGYSTLTPVQRSVLDPALDDRDLRISSQTGSGKTLAIGFVLRSSLGAESRAQAGVARPRALVITPTRELAKQVEAELGWLYAPKKVRIVSVTGGASYRDEHRALAQGPAVVVGTPGRLLDHLKRGAIDAATLSAVVLDEADRMLDLGFREELEAILGMAPAERRTHLVSATFAREVTALANRVQRDPLSVEGTPLGSANTDIDHVLHVVAARERVAALVNVLLQHSTEQTLVFVKTRADVADVTSELERAGFSVGSLSGEMEQKARLRALSAFKHGELRVLVATDVAARGIDVQDIARVVQLEPPNDADTYTHRSGRTGRAGRKGTSTLLVPPTALNRTLALLRRAGIRHRIEAVPSAETIRAAQDERLFAELTKSDEDEGAETGRSAALVQRIVAAGYAARALERLLARGQKLAEPREITPVGLDRSRAAGPAHGHGAAARPRAPRREGVQAGFTAFRISWGDEHGADARRLVAMLCRRGQIRGSDIGAIHVDRMSSTVEVATRVARAFAAATRAPDPRDPRVRVSPVSEANGRAHAPAKQKNKKR